MKRDLDRLSSEQFDLLVIGGGIYGAFVAWDAAARGLSVALVEKSDFMSGTSSNSLKVLHGGLRYLPDMRLDRVRRMVRERSAMMRLAPHLVRPLPFALPTHGRGMRSRAVLGLGLRLNDALSIDRNRDLPPDLHLPPGRLLSRSEFRSVFPGYVSPEPISGAALWYDAQIVDTERFGVSVLKSAYVEGACLANYVEATGIQSEGQRVTGATLKDSLTGETFQVRSQVVINACGPWTVELLERLGVRTGDRPFDPSLAMNAVIDRTAPEMALGIPLEAPLQNRPRQSSGGDLIFLVPLKAGAIIGTIHEPYQRGWTPPATSEHLLERLIAAVNRRLPAMELEVSDVRMVHTGLLPSHPGPGDEGRVDLVREGYVIDHRVQGHSGLLSIVGVKFTSARDLAERAIDRALALHPRPARTCQTRSRAIAGGGIGSLPAYIKDQERRLGRSLPRPLLDDLVRSYGTDYKDVLAELPNSSNAKGETALTIEDVMLAKVRYAVISEMAQSLEDVVRRRIGIGDEGCPSPSNLALCASEMAPLLGWTPQEVERQIAMAVGVLWNPVLAA